MATDEASIGNTEGNPMEKTSHSADPLPMLADISTPLNFAHLTPSQFGISSQSFTPASSNHKNKSRLAQMKERRRSNIGVRGSPETNSLIRFMAQHRMKNSSQQRTPELVKSCPRFPRVPSMLRQKMASFQSLMDVEEREGRDLAPERDGDTRGCIKTGDYLSDGGKENHLPKGTPTPTKRRRVGPLKGCEVEIREASTPSILHFSLKEQEEDEEPAAQTVTKGPLPSAEDAHAALIAPPHLADMEPAVSAELRAFSPVSRQQDGGFELQAPSRVPPDDLAAAPPAERPPLHIPSPPSQLEMKPAAAGEDPSSAAKKTKSNKRVHFGGPLSPEFFDKTLPPSTPLQKGATPGRAPLSGRCLKPRSVLKTPQRIELLSPEAHPDPASTIDFGASPVLVMPRRSRTKREEPDEEGGKMAFPSLEDPAVTYQSHHSELMRDPQLNLNGAFLEESSSPNLTGSSHPENPPSPSGNLHIAEEPESLPESPKQPELAAEAPPRPGKRKKPEECDSTPEASSRSSGRKRKLPDEGEPVRRSTRSAAKSASEKVASAAGRRWSKEVNRSLYGSRVYASKNPTLSPIRERLSFASPSPAAQQTSASNQKADAPQEFGGSVISDPTSEASNDTQEISSNTTKNTLQAPSEAPVAPHYFKGVTRKSRKSLGRRSAPRGINKRRVAVPGGGALDGRPWAPPEDKTEATTCSQVSAESPPGDTTAQHQGFVTQKHGAPTSADPPGVESERESERHACADASTSARPPLGDQLNTLSVPAESAQRGAEQAWSWAGGPQMSRDEEEGEGGRGTREGTASQQTNNHGSGSDGCDAEAASLDLAPWQAEFNLEDVFMPVASRGKRSVRRSLRNQSNAEGGSAGLVWLPQSLPDAHTGRRKTRGRRSSTLLPILLEDASGVA